MVDEHRSPKAVEYRTADTWRHRGEILSALEQISRHDIAAAHAADAENNEIDGYRTSSRPAGGHASGVADPVLAAVLKIAAGKEPTRDEPGTPDTWRGRRETDVVGRQVADAVRMWKDLHRIAYDLLRFYVSFRDRRTPAEPKERQIAQCVACERDVMRTDVDPIRSGFCGACYKAWRRAGCPDRSCWLAERREDLAERRGAAS